MLAPACPLPIPFPFLSMCKWLSMKGTAAEYFKQLPVNKA